jgi:voltage-gated potassium channel
VDLRTLRLLRILRLARLFRYDPYTRSLTLFVCVIYDRRGELLVCLMLALVTIGFSAGAMYLAEGNVQQANLGSMSAALWWAVIHLTTIGYGDVVPQTLLGRLIAAVTALMGIGIVTLPGTIIAMSYVDRLRAIEQQPSQQDSPPR